MVDCFDRIAVQMTEMALEPIRLLAQRSTLHSVALRTSSNGRRFTIGIAKRFAAEDEKTPRYVWSIEEIEISGGPMHGGALASLPMEQAFLDPETAYWSAVERLCEIAKNTKSVGEG